MDYVVEAKKFVQQAADSGHPDVVKEYLKIADWFLCQEIGQRDAASSQSTGKPAELLSNPA